MSVEKAILLDEQAASGTLGPGYITHRPLLNAEGKAYAVEKVFVPMLEGPFEPTTEIQQITLENNLVVDIHVTNARYLTPEEIAQKEQKDLIELEKSALSIKKLEIERAIQALAPQLKIAFSSLTKDEQVEFASDFDTVERRLNDGDVDFARAIIAAKKPSTENGTAVQATMVAALDSILDLMKG